MEPSIEDLQHLLSQHTENLDLEPSDFVLLDHHNAMSSIKKYFSSIEALTKNSAMQEEILSLISRMGQLMRRQWSQQVLLQLFQHQAILQARKKEYPTPKSLHQLARELCKLWEEIITSIGAETQAFCKQKPSLRSMMATQWISSVRQMKYLPKDANIDEDAKEMNAQIQLQRLWLQSKESDQPASLESYLITLSENTQTDYLFDSNLFKLLVRVGNPQDLKTLYLYYLEKMQEKNVTLCQIHPNIAQKQLNVISSCLIQYRTEDRVEQRPDAAVLLNIFCHFLDRYEPLLCLDQNNNQTNATFSKKKLLQQYSRRHQMICEFVLEFIIKIDKNSGMKDGQGSVEVRRQLIYCSRALLKIRQKQQYQPTTLLKELIYKCIIVFAPLEQEYISFYFNEGLLKDVGMNPAETPLVSARLQEEYMQFIQTILAQKHTCKLFVTLINEFIDSNNEKQFIQKEKKNIIGKTGKDIGQNSRLRVINILNKMSWSVSYAFRYNPSVLQNISLPKLNQVFSNAIEQSNKSYPDLQRCYILNSYFIQHINNPDNNNSNYTNIMKALDTCDTRYYFQEEFLLTILSKILLSDSICKSVEFEELEILVKKLHLHEALDDDHDRLMKLCIALTKVLIVKMETDNHDRVRSLFTYMISKKITNFKAFSQPIEKICIPQLKQAICLFKKLKEISQFLKQELKSSNLPRHAFPIIDWTCSTTQTVIAQFEIKHFGKRFRHADKQNFNKCRIEFPKDYFEFLSSYIALTTAARDIPRSGKDSIDIINIAKEGLQDFISQTLFQKDYLPCVLEFYNWALVNSVDSCDERINDSVSAVTEYLHKWEGDSDVQKEKYAYWKKVVRMFALKLNGKNKEQLVRLFEDLQLQKTPSDSVKGIIEVYHQLVGVLHEQCIIGGKPVEFLELNSFFVTTFETLFSSSVKHSTSTFDRLTQLLFCQIDFLASLSPPLEPNSKKDNNQIAFTPPFSAQQAPSSPEQGGAEEKIKKIAKARKEEVQERSGH